MMKPRLAPCRASFNEKAENPFFLIRSSTALRIRGIDPCTHVETEQTFSGRIALRARHTRKHHRQRDVLPGRHRRNEVEGLKDDADVPSTMKTQLLAGHLSQIALEDSQRALGWPIEPGNEIEQCRFAEKYGHRARRPTITRDPGWTRARQLRASGIQRLDVADAWSVRVRTWPSGPSSP